MKRLKIAYCSMPFFADYDFSLLAGMKENKENPEIHYFLELSFLTKKSAISEIQPKTKAGIYPAAAYPELLKFDAFVDIDKMFIINRTSIKALSLSNLWLDLKFFVLLSFSGFNVLHFNSFPDFNRWYYYLLRSKILLTIHDPFLHSGESNLRTRLKRKIAFLFVKNYILLNNKQSEEFVIANKLKNCNITVTGIGNFSVIRKFMPTLREDAHILFFGRISPYKGIEYLLEAMKKVHVSFPDTRLIVAGSGKYYFDKSEYEHATYITFINRYIEVEELTSLISNAIFCVCPYTDATQSGVISTAFALEIPVLATMTGGIEETIINGINGMVIPPKDCNALTNAMSDLISKPGLIEQMRKNIAGSNQETSFGWAEIIEKTIKAYKNI